MNWQRIDTNISFHDPLSRFNFRTVDAGVELDFRDWRDRLIRFRFQNVSHFLFASVCPLPDFPGEGFYRIEESPLVAMLRECRALQTEPASHYIVAHNEDELCEIVAESHRIAIDDVDT